MIKGLLPDFDLNSWVDIKVPLVEIEILKIRFGKKGEFSFVYGNFNVVPDFQMEKSH